MSAENIQNKNGHKPAVPYRPLPEISIWVPVDGDSNKGYFVNTHEEEPVSEVEPVQPVAWHVSALQSPSKPTD